MAETAKTKWTKQAAGRYTTIVTAPREGDHDVEIEIEQNWDGNFGFATRTEWVMHTTTGFYSEYDWEPFATLRDAKRSAQYVIDHIHYTEQQRLLAL